MDDLLEAFKLARRKERELRAGLERWVAQQSERGELVTYGMYPEWAALALATDAFQKAAVRLADYLLGVE